ncbi:FkbM family methyltransferase [Arenibaculum pallidiluteum]|uniref:FkbM family methyltransferase n=1 Tax=Arenibaculum pallidiluteum TaxID=2812559 RepID=UPI001A976822|nr:FkbM family methyltransferase [Arenibaculum pallidiluteum]
MKGMHMRKVFIDLGANHGVVTEKFGREHPDFELFTFEPNQALRNDIAAVAQKLGRNIVHHSAAAWIRDGQISFFQSNEDVASTIVSGKREHPQYGFSQIDYSKHVTVPCVDISRWIVSAFTANDFIVLKMDIEGAEYAVLTKMIFDGSLGMVRELICEWHYDRYPHMTPEEHVMIRNKAAQICKLVDWH